MKLMSSQLLAFWQIHENRSVHGAARKLGLTQTAITQRLKVLETELKVSLFTRTRRGMEITPEIGRAHV